MKKRKNDEKYDQTNLSKVGLAIEERHRYGGVTKRPKINFENLEMTIKSLPKEFREALEKYFGLISGTICHADRIKSDLAYTLMQEKASNAIEVLQRFASLVKYEENTKAVAEKIYKKMKKTHDDNDIRYLMFLIIFLEGGPELMLISEDMEEERAVVDEYVTTQLIWENNLSELPDGSINMRLLKEMMSNFELQDMATIKKFLNIPMRNSEREMADEIYTVSQLRAIKEKVFPRGEWTTLLSCIYGDNEEVQDETLRVLPKIAELRKDWSLVSNYEIGQTIVKTFEGEKKVSQYKLGKLIFNDVEEIIQLYLCGRYL